MKMRRINPDIKALFMSGYSLENGTKNVIDEGVCGFIEKPFQESILLNRVGMCQSNWDTISLGVDSLPKSRDFHKRKNCLF